MILSQSLQKYAFVLGHCPELSRLEIIRTLEHESLDFRPVFYNQQVFIVETESLLNVSELQERLGGTIKISQIMYHVSRINLEDTVCKIINDLRPKTYYQKFQFGFSYYGNQSLKVLPTIGLKIKKELKEKDINSRFIVAKEPALSSVIIEKEKLIDKGVDLVIIQSKNDFFIGHTVSVQKFEEYSKRDYGRPNRDDKSGMLPPKLAKIMLNISQTDFNQVILDPFCGSGTIIQEALLLGYKNFIGSDISERAFNDSRNNLDWLKVKYHLDIAAVKILQLDATQLSKKIATESVDCIVTEPYLGPALLNPKSEIPALPAGRRNQKQIQNHKFKIQNTLSELSTLYLQAFGEFYKVLKNGGKIVIVFPIINGQSLDILEQVKSIGFKIEPLSDELRQSIIYFREGQNVLREIFVFRKE